jgi:hypothetical protein
VAYSMRRTRAAYHYAIRRSLHREDDIVRDRFAQALMTITNRHQDFWHDVRKIRARKLISIYAIDGYSSVEEIASYLAKNIASNVPAFPMIELTRVKLLSVPRVDCIVMVSHLTVS